MGASWLMPFAPTVLSDYQSNRGQTPYKMEGQQTELPQPHRPKVRVREGEK